MPKRQPGANSKRQYERGASQMMAASAELADMDWAVASPAERIDALLAYLGSTETLCKGTVSHYIQCARVAIERILERDGSDGIAQAVNTARRLLTERAGIPYPLWGASLKLKDPLVVELGDVFAHLRSKFIETRDPLDLLLALYIIVMPRIGLRPVEITRAEWDGNRLFTYTAKRADRPKRYVPHEHWPPVYKAALGLFLRLVPRELDDAGFEAWRDVLASRLARASRKTRTKRRLSLYFARHIAIATWKQAGITPELIAHLAGHAGLKSQNSYASGRSGYGSRYLFVDRNEAQALLGAATEAGTGGPDTTEHTADIVSGFDGSASGPPDHAIGAGGKTAVPLRGEPVFDFDMPVPGRKKVEPSNEEGGRLWTEAVRKQEAALDQLETDMARARKSRMPSPPMRDKDADSPDRPRDNDAADGQQKGVKPG